MILTEENENCKDDGGQSDAEDIVDEVAADDGENDVGPGVEGVQVLKLVSRDLHRCFDLVLCKKKFVWKKIPLGRFLTCRQIYLILQSDMEISFKIWPNIKSLAHSYSEFHGFRSQVARRLFDHFWSELHFLRQLGQ